MPLASIKYKQYCDYLWITSYSKVKISSTHVRHRAGSRDEMRWIPFIEGLWITRMPPDHAWGNITGTNETKWMRWVWKNGGMNFVVGENERNPEKTYTDSVSSTKPTWSDRDANSWLQRQGAASNHLRHVETTHVWSKKNVCNNECPNSLGHTSLKILMNCLFILWPLPVYAFYFRANLEGSIVIIKNFDFDFFMDFNFITPTF